MKLFACLLSRSVLVAPIFASSVIAVQAQGVECTVGTLDRTEVAAAPTRLTATLTPVIAKSEVKGGISFGLAEDGLEVSGRLDGLDPNKRYQLRVALSKEEPSVAEGRDPKSTCVATPSRADKADGDLGVLLADVSGGIEIKSSLKGVGLSEGDRVVLGKTLILTEIPAKGESGAPMPVASATVKVPEPRTNPVQQPSSLDEIGPGERWF